MDYPQDFENFWAWYGESGTSKGSKREALKSYKKVRTQWMKEENETDPVEFSRHIKRGWMAIQANRQAARKANKHVPYLPHASTWLNQWRFEEEHTESTGSLKAQEVDRTCACGNPQTIGRSEDGSWICRKCDLDEWKERNTLKPLVDKYPKMRSESWRDWSIRVMSEFPAGRALKRRYGDES